jgi:uncharacterized protein (TIGR02001 family)
MKRFVSGAAGVAAAILLSALGSEAYGQEVEVSGNVAIASDYAFRGISQTLEKPAVQGGFDLSVPVGLYAGVWGSSVNFGEDLAGGARAQMELDVYGGFAPSVGGFDLDVGLLYYAYPGAFSGYNYDFFEAYGGLARTFGPLTAGLVGAWSPDFFAASGRGLLGAVEISAAAPGWPVGLDASVGRQIIEDNEAFGTPDYTVWSIGLSTELFGSTVGGMVTGTDLNRSDCFGGDDLCRARVIVSVSRGL